jgi:hypothetical protein
MISNGAAKPGIRCQDLIKDYGVGEFCPLRQF